MELDHRRIKEWDQVQSGMKPSSLILIIQRNLLLLGYAMLVVQSSLRSILTWQLKFRKTTMRRMSIHLDSMLWWVKTDGYISLRKDTQIGRKDQNSVFAVITTTLIGSVSLHYLKSGKDSSWINLGNLMNIKRLLKRFSNHLDSWQPISRQELLS